MRPETKKLTRETGLSQKELAAALEVTRQHLAAVVSGERKSAALIQRLAALRAKKGSGLLSK